MKLKLTTWHPYYLIPDARFPLVETDHFINVGFGWMCRRCAARDEPRPANDESRARFFTEGEAEAKEPALSTPALARWRDAARRTLYCPRCGIEEMVDKA